MANARDPHDLSILFELFVVSQRVRELLGRAMADSPIRPDEYAVYSLLQSEGPQSPTAMARRLGMPVTTLLEYTTGMANRGHVVRSPNPADGRSYLLALTASGFTTQKAAAALFDKAMYPLLEELDSPSAVRQALGALGQAVDRLVEQSDRATTTNS